MKDELKQNIEKMKAELAKMEAELEKSEKVELECGTYTFYLNGNVCNNFLDASNNYIVNGATRATEELAEIAVKNMVARNKLEAYAMQLEPEWRDEGFGINAYEIYLSRDGKYCYVPYENIRTIGTVHMSKQTAETLCQWLNEGRITLEKE